MLKSVPLYCMLNCLSNESNHSSRNSILNHKTQSWGINSLQASDCRSTRQISENVHLFQFVGDLIENHEIKWLKYINTLLPNLSSFHRLMKKLSQFSARSSLSDVSGDSLVAELRTPNIATPHLACTPFLIEVFVFWMNHACKHSNKRTQKRRITLSCTHLISHRSNRFGSAPTNCLHYTKLVESAHRTTSLVSSPKRCTHT